MNRVVVGDCLTAKLAASISDIATVIVGLVTTATRITRRRNETMVLFKLLRMDIMIEIVKVIVCFIIGSTKSFLINAEKAIEFHHRGGAE